MAKAQASDLEKVMEALSFLTSVRSLNDVLGVFGLQDLPSAQKWGIIFGIMTFTVTVGTVITLLVLGGSFKRIAEQEETGGVSIPGAVEERVNRPLLLERLLEAQIRLLEKYDAEKIYTDGMTPLVTVLLNIAPDISKAMKLRDTLVEEGAEESKKKEELKKYIPDGYEKNYIHAYRRCQDKPGGGVISGLPEARYEAYARAYAGCGIHTSTDYRRSYARMYESVACIGHATEEKYRSNWTERPGDIVGRNIRLEPLDADRHSKDFFAMTCGDIYKENKAFDPHEVWAFFPQGPFRTAEEMRKSCVFERRANEAGFAIVESLTDNLVGVIFVTNDNPKNLSISIEVPIVKPSSEGTAEPIEACFLLMDRLFALGYRRIQYSIDSMDTNGKKLAGRLGVTQEGLILKERVVKESNRDSIIYAMLNSDWSKGARAYMYKKLHGDKAMNTDIAMNKREAELEEQTTHLEGVAKKAEESSEIIEEKKKK